MASQAQRAPRAFGSPLFALVVAIAVLYLAREVIIPLALAGLFAFVLAPLVRRLEALRIGRPAATFLSVAIGMAVIVGVGWVAVDQAVSLAGKLPEYKDNITRKLRDLRSAPQGNLGKAAKAIKELESETAGKPRGAAEKPAAAKPPAVDLPTTPLEFIARLGLPLAALLVVIAAVIVISTLMLLQRDDLRDRIVRLGGEGRIHITTQAMDDAAGRVSRYLLTLLVVNICYGAPLGIALYLLGIPNALLWGLLATILRFIPYVGAPAAAVMPITLAFAIADGWGLIAWTIGVIVVLEFIVAYVIEPWLYGSSTGLSPIAIVFAAIFWTWLWGPIGLLLATPLTVCIAVVGRYIPRFSFLSVILGADPVLPPHVRLYQRVRVLEHDEAVDLAEQYVREHGLVAAYEGMLMPALLLAKRDSRNPAADPQQEQDVLDELRRVTEELEERVDEREPAAERATAPAAGASAAAPLPAPAVCLVPARDEADSIAAMMLARAIAPERYLPYIVPHEKLASEVLEEIAAHCDKAVLISAVPPSAAANASYLCKRLRQRFPQLKIVVALWHAEGNFERVAARLRQAGADEVVTRMPEAMERIRLIAPHGAA